MAEVDESLLPFKLGGLPTDLIDYDYHIGRFKQSKKSLNGRTPSHPDIGWDLKSMQDSAHYAAFSAWALRKNNMAKQWGMRAMEATEEYFFGDYLDVVPSGNYAKNPPDRTYHERTSPWKAAFESALLWCSSLGEWDRLVKIAGYLRDDVKPDIEQSIENRAWLLLVAGVVRGRDYPELAQYSQAVLNGKKARERILLWILDAILNEASTEASDQLAQYAKRYFKIEYPKYDISTKIALDATFLIHWARYSDVELVVPDKLRPHIVALGDSK